MKKLICICLALMLTLGAAVSLADEDYSKDEVTIKLPEASGGLEKAELNDSARALKSTDDVVNVNGLYTVTTADGLLMVLDATSLPYLVLTQNYYASLDVYTRLDEDAAVNLLDQLISYKVHFLVMDAYQAFQEIQVSTPGSDALSRHVRDLATLNENEVKAVASALASSCNVSDYSLYSFNGSPWIQIGANRLLTIKNGGYVQAVYLPNGNQMTEDDYTDFTEFMKALTLK